MSEPATPPGVRLRHALRDRIDNVGVEVAAARRLLHDLNRPSQPKIFTDLRDVLTACDEVLADYAAGTAVNIADGLAGLLSATQAVEVSPFDPDTGEEDYSRRQLDYAQARLVRGLLGALEAARAAGIVPTDPGVPGGQTLVVPRSGNEDLLREVADNLDRVAARLEALEQVRAEPSTIVQQGNFIAFFVGQMRVQIDLAKLQMKVGEHTIDFAALARAGAAMADLTGDFFATITAWAGMVSAGVAEAARAVNRAVAGASRGLGRAIRVILTRRGGGAGGASGSPAGRQPEPAVPVAPSAADEPSPDFDLEAATKMILEGQVPPSPWWPHITRLDLSGRRLERSEFADLAPLQALTNLRTLDCDNTQVSDLAPLQALTNLRTLDCSNTQVSDLAPLQALTNLRTLSCNNTQVSDLAPLQALTNLQTLSCWGTQVSDLAPLQALTNLQWLSCFDTQVSDLAPLQALTNLRTLYCANTQVSDLAPLQALTNLQTLNCANTQVSDLAPLQALTNLRTLACSDTQVSDLAPLQALTNLQTLVCRNTHVADFSVLRDLKGLTINGEPGNAGRTEGAIRRGLRRLLGGPGRARPR